MSLEEIEAFVFDFDGVLTNNFVYMNQDGQESVSCSRADGLAFNALRKLNKPTFILSSEKNPVVAMRAHKLQIPAIQGVSDKVEAIKLLANKNNFNLDKIFYVGNDINDFYAMSLCGFTACPANSHPRIKKISNIILKTKGGDGVIRDLMEDIFHIDLVKVLYNSQKS